MLLPRRVEADGCTYCTGLMLRRPHRQPALRGCLDDLPGGLPKSIDTGSWASGQGRAAHYNSVISPASRPKGQKYLGADPDQTTVLLAFSLSRQAAARTASQADETTSKPHMRPETRSTGTARNRLPIYRDEEGEGILLSAVVHSHPPVMSKMLPHSYWPFFNFVNA